MATLIRVFHSLYKVGRNGIIGINGFNNSKKVTSSGARPDARDYYWLKSPMPNLAKLAFACNSETFRSLYSHALLILTKSKTHVVHEQKFKDPLTSTCQFSSVGWTLDS